MFRHAAGKLLYDALHDRKILLADSGQFRDWFADGFLRAPAEHLFSRTRPPRDNQVSVPFNHGHGRVVRMRTQPFLVLPQRLGHLRSLLVEPDALMPPDRAY